jgi:hypothetical protein
MVMEVNQNQGGGLPDLVSHAVHVLRLLNRFVACQNCRAQRRELEVFLDRREDAEAGGSQRGLRDADWYIKTASQMALSHLIVDHGARVA